MTRRTQSYYSFNTGELDPALHERADVKHYYSALKTAKNLIGAPQGGAQAKFGSWHRAILRRQMAAVSLAGGSNNAPNGGTAANAVDGNSATVLTTASISTTSFVAFTRDFGSTVDLAAFDVRGVKCATLSASDVLKVQSSPDNAVWTDFGAAKPLSTTARDLRFALAPKQTRAARFWRVLAVDAPGGLGALTIGDVFCWSAGSLSAVKQIEINVDPSAIYTLALTGGNADVFEAGAWRAAIAIPHSSAQLEELNFTQSIDTVILFHKDVAPRKLLRLGTATQWDSTDVVFSDVPLFDFGDTAYSNGVNEKQVIHFNNFDAATQFVLTAESYSTEAITYSLTGATLAGLVKAALEALPNVDAGLTVTVDYGDGTGNIGLRVEFSGGANATRAWLPMVIKIVQPVGSESATIDRPVTGLAGGESLWSATRGYPRHGVFYQQRLVMGGFRSRGNAIAYSRTGEFFDFDVNFDAPSGAIVDLLDADDDRTIRRFHVGKDLQIFTNTSAHYVSSRTIDRDQPRDYVQAARAGIVPGSRSIDLQGATVFIEAGGEVLREFVYSAVDANYQTTNLSILSSHLITGALDLAVRRSSSASDADLVLLAKSNGLLTVVTALRAEEVMGITWLSDVCGAYRAVACDNAGLIYLARERLVAGVTELVLETADFDLELDAAVTGTVVGTTVTGLDALEGWQVYAYFDGSPYGPFTVTAGSIAHGLEDAPAEAIVGLWDPAVGETLPLRAQDSESAPRRKKRIHKVWASIMDTGNLALGANGGAAREVALWGFSDPVDVALRDRLVTGEVKRAGIAGWSHDGSITFTQTMPAALHVRGLRAEYDG